MASTTLLKSLTEGDAIVHCGDFAENVHFLQNRGIVIDGVSFYGLAFRHPESNIPGSVDILVTHEPPLAILHGIEGTNWGNLPLLKRIYDVKPKFHLFGHILNLEQEPIIINI